MKAFLTTLLLLIPLQLMAQVKEIPVSTSSDEARKYFMEGRNESDDFNNPQAISLLNQAIKADPEFVQAYLLLSQLTTGQEAQQHLDNAVKRLDRVSEGEKLLVLSQQALLNSDGKKLKEILDQLLTKYPEDKRVHLSAGWINNVVFRDYPRAEAELKRAVELDPEFGNAYNLLGLLSMQQNKNAEAEKALKKYIALVPDNPNPYDSYAEFLLNTGRYDESIVQYRKALAIDPAFSFSLIGIGHNNIFKGDFEAARASYQQLFDKSQLFSEKSNALLWKAISFVHEGKLEDIIRAFDEAREFAEKNNQVGIVSDIDLSITLAFLNKPADARKYANKVDESIRTAKLSDAEEKPITFYFHAVQAVTDASNNDLEKALKTSDELMQAAESMQLSFHLVNANLFTGYIEMKRGNLDHAIEHLANAGNDPLASYYTASILEKKGKTKEAQDILQAIQKRNDNGSLLRRQERS